MSAIPNSDELADEINSEVMRVEKLLRFILKFRKQFQPSGIEFSDLRQYNAQDDASKIDWKSSARSQDIFVKEFDEERDLDVFIILDTSDSMLFGTADKLKSEYSAILASTLAYASVNVGINVGIGFFGEKEKIMTPSSGMEQYQAILKEVSDPENYGGKFNLENALDGTIGMVKPDTFIFIISDFIGAGEQWTRKLRVASEKYRHCLAIMVRDLRDYKLPKEGNFRFESPSGDKEKVVNTSKVKKRFEEEVEKQEEEVSSNVTETGSGFVKIDTRKGFAAEMMSYFDEGGSW